MMRLNYPKETSSFLGLSPSAFEGLLPVFCSRGGATEVDIKKFNSKPKIRTNTKKGRIESTVNKKSKVENLILYQK